MKKKLCYLLSASLTLFIMACGGQKENQSDETSYANESEEGMEDTEISEPASYEAPFTVLGVQEKLNIDRIENVMVDGTRAWYTIEVKKNGTYEATVKTELNSWRTGGEWMDDEEYNYSGRWTVSYRAVGDSWQKVYDLRYKNGNSFVYIPDDLEYFWSTMGLFDSADWTDCANFNFKNAIKVAEITTPKGTVVIIPENERVAKEPEIPAGPAIVGKIFVDEDVYQDTRVSNSPVYKTITKWVVSKDSIHVDRVSYENDKIDNSIQRAYGYTYKGTKLRLKSPDGSVADAEVVDDGHAILCSGIRYYLVEK